MGFRENLKSELAYAGMLVKELAALSGVSKYSLDNYLNKRGQVPSVESGVKIAQALGVSVEYLVTGSENPQRAGPLSPEIRTLLHNFKQLNEKERDLVLAIIQLVKDQGKTRV
jgi:transcriptional regulator with XRE-family HTH domain